MALLTRLHCVRLHSLPLKLGRCVKHEENRSFANPSDTNSPENSREHDNIFQCSTAST